MGHLADYREKGKAKGQREKPVPVLIYVSLIANRLDREILWDKVAKGQAFLLALQLSPVSVFPLILPTYLINLLSWEGGLKYTS